jgi:hypothetical protein
MSSMVPCAPSNRTACPASSASLISSDASTTSGRPFGKGRYCSADLPYQRHAIGRAAHGVLIGNAAVSPEIARHRQIADANPVPRHFVP